jgi:hypothetical protein
MSLTPDTARALEEALWATIVELAEASNDLAVATQASPTAQATAALGQTAADIVHLARAAEVASRHRASAP